MGKEGENIELGLRYYNLRQDYDKKKEVSQREFAKILGITHSGVCMLESGKKNITMKELKAYHSHCNVSYDYLLGEAECKKADNTEINKRLGLNDKAIKLLEVKKNDIFFIKTINDLITEYEFLMLMSSYILKGFIYEELQKTDYFLIPQKEIPSSHREIYFAKIIEKLPLLREKISKDYLIDKGLMKVLYMEYLSLHADIKLCNYYISDTEGTLIEEPEEFIEDNRTNEEIAEDYERYQKEMEEVMKKEIEDMQIARENDYKRYDAINEFFYFKDKRQKKKV